MKPWELYLSKLEFYLSSLNDQTRFELMGHARELMKEKAPLFLEMSYEQISTQLGPEKEFARELARRSNIPLSEVKTPISSAQKWFRRFAVLALIFFSAIYLLVQKYTPIFEIDEEAQKIYLFGGEMELDFDHHSIQIGNHVVDMPEDQEWGKITGELGVDEAKIQKLRLVMEKGLLSLESSKDRKLSWSCMTYTKDTPEPKTAMTNTRLEVEFLNIQVKNCNFKIPQDIATTVIQEQGKIIVKEPVYNTHLVLKQGSLIFTPHPEMEYNYMIDILQGRHSQTPRAPRNPLATYQMKVHLDSGRVAFRRSRR